MRFSEAAGRSNPLRTSTWRIALTVAMLAILLRPEVIVRHDGRREREDWPALQRAYGFGDGAFYSKHVRCRDPYAAWLAAKSFGMTGAKIRLQKRSRASPWRNQLPFGVRPGSPRRAQVRC